MTEIVRETSDTVTLRRKAYEALVRRAEDAEDHAAIAASMERRRRLGDEEAARLSYTADEVDRMLDHGVSRLTIWRERAGLSGRALAAEAGISPSYLVEIESGQKPGSVAAYKALAAVLRVPLDILIG